MNYFIYQDEQEKGPYPIGEIIKSVNYGYIAPSTLAREESSTEWIEVSSIVDISVAQAKRIYEQQQAQSQAEFHERVMGQEQKAAPSVLPSKEIKIGIFEEPFIVNLHYLVAGLCFFCGVLCLIGVGTGNRSASEAAFAGFIACISGGIGLLIAGYIISCLVECVFRLRNIEVNTAKAAEKNDR